MGAVSELDDAINEATRISPFDMWDHERGRRERMRAELARLRRMAKLLCKIAVYKKEAEDWGPSLFHCRACKAIHHTDKDFPHTKSCVVALHLDLPREKGDGE